MCSVEISVSKKTVTYSYSLVIRHQQIKVNHDTIIFRLSQFYLYAFTIAPQQGQNSYKKRKYFDHAILRANMNISNKGG